MKEPFDIDSIDGGVGPDSGDEEPFDGPEVADSAEIALVQERFPYAASRFGGDVPGGHVRVSRPRVGQDIGPLSCAMAEGDSIRRLAYRLRHDVVGRLVLAAGLRRGGERPPVFTGDRLLDVAAVGRHLLMRFDSGLTVHSDLDWWQSEGGKRYWAANVTAIKERRVKVDRIFVDGSGFPEARLPELVQLMTQQQAEGVNVFLLRLGRISPLNEAERDVTIFDDQLVHEVTSSARGVPTHVTFRRGRDATREAATHFEKVLIHAKTFDPAASSQMI